jgi:hypothetical protein
MFAADPTCSQNPQLNIHCAGRCKRVVLLLPYLLEGLTRKVVPDLIAGAGSVSLIMIFSQLAAKTQLSF